MARLVDAIADAGGSPALTSRLRDEEEKLEDLRRQAQLAGRRGGAAQRPLKEAMAAARAVMHQAADLLGQERTTTRAALVAMLEPMKLAPATTAGGPFSRWTAK